eukprot:CAMPEP_0203919340 /NCGR_PEP_ID=MMETSP0359-20131031/59780_1 /ASSEMBLY_ACC=CAM_ASM_000338 /TAXON_ID=268821 /ORGANISM="Scrippsiella Hangoei, Strain SHTV-5" /LENGTH=282 /DNA_ID=CAMNT_0050846621 /DNA_START=68 /DNA_END=914 /DNA_ORIENTATION=-
MAELATESSAFHRHLSLQALQPRTLQHPHPNSTLANPGPTLHRGRQSPCEGPHTVGPATATSPLTKLVVLLALGRRRAAPGAAAAAAEEALEDHPEEGTHSDQERNRVLPELQDVLDILHEGLRQLLQLDEEPVELRLPGARRRRQVLGEGNELLRAAAALVGLQVLRVTVQDAGVARDRMPRAKLLALRGAIDVVDQEGRGARILLHQLIPSGFNFLQWPHHGAWNFKSTDLPATAASHVSGVSPLPDARAAATNSSESAAPSRGMAVGGEMRRGGGERGR